MAKAKKAASAKGAPAKKAPVKAASAKSSSVENEKLVAVLCYFLFGIIWYFVDEKMKKSSLAKYHTKQAINLIAIQVVIYFALSILIFIGWIIMPIVSIIFFVLWVIGLIYAVQGNEKPIPIIGQFADKYLKF